MNFKYFSVPEERKDLCSGCAIYTDASPVNCINETNCNGIIWKRIEEMTEEQRKLEMYVLEFLSDRIDEIESEYYREQIEDIIDDITPHIQNGPLKDKIIDAIKNIESSNGSNSPFVKTIENMSVRLGYR